MRHILCVLLALLFGSAVRAAEPVVALTNVKAGDPPTVEATGLPKELLARLKMAKLNAKEWAPIFRVVVGGGTNEEVLSRIPLAGEYAITDTGLRFEPQFPLVPGREYVAILEHQPKQPPLLIKLMVAKPPPGPRVAISAVYPSANWLPENTLRFYIHFTGPVSRGDIYKHLKLTRDDGVVVKEPFLELPEELWSNDGNRLTVLFHPGRVKRGLVPHEEDGPILEAGRTYSLSIDEKWEDTEGRPLVAGVKKTFSVMPADMQPVNPEAWALMAPRAGGDSPLIVKLPKPLDHAMLGRVVWVTDAAGNRVPGDLTVGGGERVLTFAPKKPWTRGEYQLVIDSRLEDMCGNRVGEAFEVDEMKPTDGTRPAKTRERVFLVR
ncbi:MAG: hypothetical protein U0792_08655 [Gemmataceae bacterium]